MDSDAVINIYIKNGLKLEPSHKMDMHPIDQKYIKESNYRY